MQYPLCKAVKKGSERAVEKMKKTAEKKSGHGFLSGVLVLSCSTVLVKVLGLAYKIPMLSRLGAEGMGYFNSAYELYAMLCVIATAGLPVALSMLISTQRERGNEYAIRCIWRKALAVFLVLGGVGSAVMLIFAKPLSSAIGNEGAFLCILAIAPALFLICFSSAVRGYFQGFGNMVPTAVSQLIEALGKLIFGVGFAFAAEHLGFDVPTVAAFAVLGVLLGILLSSLYLLLVRVLCVPHRQAGDMVLTEESSLLTLLRIAFPITLSSAVLGATRLADMALMMRRLQTIGWQASEANAVYGAYTTLAVPIFSLIPSLITPISLALVPQLSAAIEGHGKDGQAQIADQAIRLTVLLSMPASMGISLYAYPILSFLFPREEETVAIAAPLLAILGISVLFSGLITTTGAILQSYRMTVKPILSMATGAVIKMVLAYVLIGTPSVGVYGAPISTLICNGTVTWINLCFLGSCIPKSRFSTGVMGVYGKPLAASALAMLASVAVYLPMEAWTESNTVAFLAAVITAVAAYIPLVLIMRAVTWDDIALLPMGKKMESAWRRGRQKKKKRISAP